MTIKSLILSGGAYLGFSQLGCIKILLEKQHIKMVDIESIYACSIGTVVAIILCLKLEWDIIYDYFIKRPWSKTVDFSPSVLLESIETKGIIGNHFFDTLFEPLFKYNDIDTNISLKTFQELHDISLNFYTCGVNKLEYKLIDDNNFPDIRLIDAVHMSCSIPLLFQPFKYKNEYYIDGGMINNYPVVSCLEKYTEEEVFGIFIDVQPSNQFDDDDNLFGFLLHIIHAMHRSVREKKINIQNEIYIDSEPLDIPNLNKCLSDSDERKRRIEYGEILAEQWYQLHLDEQ